MLDFFEFFLAKFTLFLRVYFEVSQCSEEDLERIQTCADCSRNFDDCPASKTKNCVSKNCTIDNKVVEFSVPTNIETCMTQTVTTYNQITFTHHANDCPTTSIRKLVVFRKMFTQSIHFFL